MIGHGRTWDASQSGQALVEVALVLPVLLLLALGVVGVGRVVEASMGVTAVAREAARAAALANSREAAMNRGIVRGQEVAAGYGLAAAALDLTVNPGSFQRGETVHAATRYTLSLADLPLVGWVQITLSSQHQERTDPYRSRWPATGG